MKIEIRADRAIISGYVTAVGRDSRLIPSARGAFLEQVVPGTFLRALEHAENVDLCVNHERDKVFANTRDGSLKLREDNIGLYAEATITDAKTVEQARKGEFRGWSFAFHNKKPSSDDWESTSSGRERRFLRDIELLEVSLIDKKKVPAYIGTTVEVRGSDNFECERRFEEDLAVVPKETAKTRNCARLKQTVQFLKLKGR